MIIRQIVVCQKYTRDYKCGTQIMYGLTTTPFVKTGEHFVNSLTVEFGKHK